MTRVAFGVAFGTKTAGLYTPPRLPGEIRPWPCWEAPGKTNGGNFYNAGHQHRKSGFLRRMCRGENYVPRAGPLSVSAPVYKQPWDRLHQNIANYSSKRLRLTLIRQGGFFDPGFGHYEIIRDRAASATETIYPGRGTPTGRDENTVGTEGESSKPVAKPVGFAGFCNGLRGALLQNSIAARLCGAGQFRVPGHES